MKDNLIKQTALILSVMITIILGVSLLLPGHFEIERTTIVEAAPAKVYGLVGDLQQWPKWDPWTRSDPGIQQTFDGEPGVGQTQSWKGPKSGEGTLKIVEGKINEKIVMSLQGSGRSESQKMVFTLEDLGGRARVTWKLSGPNRWRPIGNIFGLGMESFLGPIYEKGLLNLKTIAEGGVLEEPAETEN